MIVLAHRPLLNSAIYILSVRLERGTQVDVDRNARRCDQGNLRRNQNTFTLHVGKLAKSLESTSAGGSRIPSSKKAASFLAAFLLMPAITYAPTHLRVQYHRPSEA